MTRIPITRQVPGIYKITCSATSMVYIGSTNNILARWKDHISSLIHGTHDNYKLQMDWNKYGITEFLFSVVCECDIDELQSTEQYYIDLYDSAHVGYNICERAFQPPNTPESRRKQSESLNQNTEFIESSRQFMIRLHSDPEKQKALIQSILTSPRVHKTLQDMNSSEWHHKQVLGLLDQVHNDHRIQKIVKTQAERNAVSSSWRAKHNVKSVIAIDASSKAPYRVYRSLSQAAEINGYSRDIITSICKHTRKSRVYCGYIWMYLTEYQQLHPEFTVSIDTNT